jgi:UPF0755 protein
MSRRFTIVLTGLLAFVLCAFAALYFGYFLVSPAGMEKQEEIFMVKKGSGLRTIAAQLEQRRLIKGKHLFMLWAYAKGGARDIKAGEYSFHRSMTPVKIFHMLTSGAVKTYSFTIPEGLTAEQIAGLLEGGISAIRRISRLWFTIKTLSPLTMWMAQAWRDTSTPIPT